MAIILLKSYRDLTQNLKVDLENDKAAIENETDSADKLIKEISSDIYYLLENEDRFTPLLKSQIIDLMKSTNYFLNATSILKSKVDYEFDKDTKNLTKKIISLSIFVFMIVSFFAFNAYERVTNPIHDRYRLNFYEASEWDKYYYEDLDCRDPDGNDIFLGECETTSLDGGKIVREFNDYGIYYCSIHRSKTLYKYSDSPGMGLIDFYSYPCWALEPSEDFFIKRNEVRVTEIYSNYLGRLSPNGEINQEGETWPNKPNW